jgi:hypothetical protein
VRFDEVVDVWRIAAVPADGLLPVQEIAGQFKRGLAEVASVIGFERQAERGTVRA